MSSIDPCIGVSVTSLHAVVRWYCNYSSEINAHLVFIAFFVVVCKENIDISYSYIIFGSKKYSKERKKKILYLVVLLKKTNKNQI